MYEIWLLDPFKNRLAELSQMVLALSYVRASNQPGAWNITLPNAVDPLWLRPDNLIEIWRKNAAGQLAWETSGFLRKPHYFSRGGRQQISIGGPGLLYLLRGRIMAYAAGSAQAAKTDYADDMIKAVIRENLGALATDTTRDLTANGFSVQPDFGLAPSISKRFAHKKVDEVCQDIARESFQRGTPLYFDIVPSWSGETASFEFRTYINQRGADRTYSDANPMVFGEAYGNLENPDLEFDYWDEASFVYAGGQGEGDDREIETASDATRLGRSIWNRREVFVNATHLQSTAELQSAARAALDAGKPKIKFSGDLLSVPGSAYGVDWFFGDKITGVAEGQQFDGWIDKVQVDVMPSGEERIKAKFEVEQ